MNKETFLIRLEQLLYDIPREEREEAMDYYRSYFEEAGVENEAAVLEELDSPQEIAASIKEDLKGPGAETGHLKNPPQVRNEEPESQAEDEKIEFGKNAEYRRYNEPRQSAQDTASDSSSQYGQYEKQPDSSQYRQYEKQPGSRGFDRSMDRMAKFALFIILAVFALPVWGSVASAVLGVIGVAVAAVVVLGIFAVSGVLGGLACVVVGIVNLCMLSVAKGLVALGVGMLLIAGGGISFVFLLLLCGRFLPWAVRQIANLLHRLLDWGRSIA